MYFDTKYDYALHMCVCFVWYLKPVFHILFLSTYFLVVAPIFIFLSNIGVVVVAVVVFSIFRSDILKKLDIVFAIFTVYTIYIVLYLLGYFSFCLFRSFSFLWRFSILYMMTYVLFFCLICAFISYTPTHKLSRLANLKPFPF